VKIRGLDLRKFPRDLGPRDRVKKRSRRIVVDFGR
jgi:hypothetical protein